MWMSYISIVKVLIKTFNWISNMAIFGGWTFMIPFGGRVMMTLSGGIVETGGKQDRFRSLNLKILIKTFKLIPNMAVFRGWPLMTPLGLGSGLEVSETQCSIYCYSTHQYLRFDIKHARWLFMTPQRGGVKVMMILKEDTVRTRGEQDSFRSLNV